MTNRWTGHSSEIECDGCANSIRRTLGKIDGVSEVEVEVAEKRIQVQYDPAKTNEASIKERLSLAGFPADA
jgi:copper chaperone CopZ